MRALYLVAAVAVLALLSFSTYTVQETEQAIVVQFGRPVRHAAGKLPKLLRGQSFLKAEEPDRSWSDIEQWREEFERQRPVAIVLMFRSTGPNDSDLKACFIG